MKCYREISTTVGITIGYLTSLSRWVETLSTTVEITIGYLTSMYGYWRVKSTTVEISIGYLTRTANIYMPNLQYYITFLPLIVSSITFYIYTSILHTILVSPSKSL